MIWVGDWQVVVQKNRVGGKGGGSQVTGNNLYYASVVMALCTGQITSDGVMWYQDSTGLNKRDNTWVQHNFVVFQGDYAQNPWDWLWSHHIQQALAYRGVALLCKSNWSLGSSSSFPQVNLEVTGLLPYGGHLDAEPSRVLYDFLTDTKHGANFPAANVADWSYYASANLAVGILLSPLMDQQKSAAEWMKQILEETMAQAVWSDGLLKIVPYYDQAVSSVDGTFTPNLTPVVASTSDDDYLVTPDRPEEPVTVTRQLPADRFNEVRLEVINRSDNYKVVPVMAKSQSDIDVYSQRPAQPKAYHEIARLDVGYKVAWLQLQRGLNVMNTYQFKLGQQYIWLDPLDIWPLTDAQLGMVNAPVRVTEVELDEHEELVVTCEDLGVCNLEGANYGGQPVGELPPPDTDPGKLLNVNRPLIFEVSPQLVKQSGGGTGGQAVVRIAVSGASGNFQWGGCSVWYSLDGSTYQRLGQVTQAAQMGVLLADLPAFNGIPPDNVNTMQLDLSESVGVVQSVSDGQASQGYNMAVLANSDGTNAEFFTFATVATGTGSFQYNCTDLYRAWDIWSVNRSVGISAPSHAASVSIFAWLNYRGNEDQAVFTWAYPPGIAGSPVYFKFTSFNLNHSEEQSLSDVSAYIYTPQGLPAVSPTLLDLFDTPALTDADTGAPGFYMAGGPSIALQEWTGADVNRSVDGGVTFTPFSSIPQASCIGHTTTVLPVPGAWATWDIVSSVTVRPQTGAQLLVNATNELAVLNGANLALVGGELVGFMTVVNNGDGTYTLGGGMTRGRRGTDPWINTHVVGEQFVLVAGAQVSWSEGTVDIGVSKEYQAVSFDAGVQSGPVTFAEQGNRLKPYAVCHVAGSRDGSGNLTVSWVRRTRIGGDNSWADGITEVPLGETSEAYQVDVLSGVGGTVLRTLVSGTPSVAYSAAQQTTDFGSLQSVVNLNVYMMSGVVGRGFAEGAAV